MEQHSRTWSALRQNIFCFVISLVERWFDMTPQRKCRSSYHFNLGIWLKKKSRVCLNHQFCSKVIVPSFHPKFYDFLSSVEHKRRYFLNILLFSGLGVQQEKRHTDLEHYQYMMKSFSFLGQLFFKSTGQGRYYWVYPIIFKIFPVHFQFLECKVKKKSKKSRIIMEIYIR